MAVDDGWIHVKHKSRRHASSPAKKAAAADLSPETFTPRTTGVLRPPEALRADHDRIHAQWLESPAHEALVRLVEDHAKGLRISKVVCLGIGTFDPDDGAWEAKRAAYVQLCALSTLRSKLQLHNKASIDCIFQEPILTESDTAFLTALGHRVVASPAAYELIDDTTLLFAVHLYRPIYAAALKASLPAIFVGTGWDVWDTVTMEKSSDLDNMKKMDDTYTRHVFPQDTASTAFSSTSIYFRPPLDSAPSAAQSLSPGVANDCMDKLGKESAAKVVVRKTQDASHASTKLSADKDRHETKAADERDNEETSDSRPSEAKGLACQGTAVKDQPIDGKGAPQKKKQNRKQVN